MWGDSESVDRFLKLYPEIDVILGADVVCWPHLVKPLLDTVKVRDVVALPINSIYDTIVGDYAAIEIRSSSFLLWLCESSVVDSSTSFISRA